MQLYPAWNIWEVGTERHLDDLRLEPFHCHQSVQGFEKALLHHCKGAWRANMRVGDTLTTVWGLHGH